MDLDDGTREVEEEDEVETDGDKSAGRTGNAGDSAASEVDSAAMSDEDDLEKEDEREENTDEVRVDEDNDDSDSDDDTDFAVEEDAVGNNKDEADVIGRGSADGEKDSSDDVKEESVNACDDNEGKLIPKSISISGSKSVEPSTTGERESNGDGDEVDKEVDDAGGGDEVIDGGSFDLLASDSFLAVLLGSTSVIAWSASLPSSPDDSDDNSFDSDLTARGLRRFFRFRNFLCFARLDSSEIPSSPSFSEAMLLSLSPSSLLFASSSALLREDENDDEGKEEDHDALRSFWRDSTSISSEPLVSFNSVFETTCLRDFV